MKTTLKKTLALALALLMCASLLPISALAAAGGGATPANPPTVTIEGTPMLIKGDYQHEAGDKTPFLSVSWNYGDFSLPDGEVYGATVYAWAGTETTRPSSYWKKDIDATGNGGSFSGKLVSVGNPDQIYSNCMVRVSFSYNGSTYSDTKQGVATVQGGSGYTAPVSVTISGTPTLSGSSSPSLSVGWNYGKNLTGDYSGMIYAWKDDGNNGALPQDCWYQEFTDGNGGTSDSTTVALAKMSDSTATLEGTCWVQVSLSLSAQAIVSSAPVSVSFGSSSSGGGGTNEHLPVPSTSLPVIEAVTYYDKDYSYLVDYSDTYHGYPAVWYMYTEGSNNLEVFALLPADSESAATSASVSGYSGFQSDGQWYSVAGFWTVNPSTDLTDKDGTHRTLMTPLYCGDGSVPAQGTTLYLSLWDYENSGMSNLVPVTVPGTGATASAEGTTEPHPTITISSLPNGSTLSDYSATLTGEGVADQTGALTWTVSGLPAGLNVNATTGAITGRPTQDGTFTVSVTLTQEGVTKTAGKSLSLTVTGAAPTIHTATLADATWGMAYTATLAGTAAKGGALTWALDEGSDALPSGITLAENGTLSGTAAQGTERDYTLKFKLSEAGNDKQGTATLTFKVKAPAGPSITINANLPRAKAKLEYSLPLTGTASVLGGTLSWSLAEGSSLPAGLSLSANGTLSGTPAEAAIQSEAYSFTVKLTETKGDFTLTATKTLYLTVAEPAYYNVYFYLSGGTAPAGSEGDYADRSHVLETTQITLPAAPTKTGYDFEAWYTGGELYQPGAAVTVTETLYIYARWKEKAPTAVVYTGPQLLGNAYLVGTYSYTYNNRDYTATVTLDSDYSRTRYTPQMEIAAYNLNRNYTHFGLYTYVDGVYTKVAEYAGAIADGTPSVTLTTVDGLSLAPVTAVSAAGLTSGTDYSVGSIRISGRYVSLPFLTDTSNANNTFQVKLNGVSSSANYDKYNWSKLYTATLSDGVLSVTPDSVPDGVSISGTVKFGTGANAQPMAGVQVQVHQNAYGQDRNRIAVTGSDGAYTVNGLLAEGAYTTIQVLSGGQSLYCDSNYHVTADDVKDINVTKAAVRISTELDLSASVDGLTDAQRGFVQRELGWKSVGIAFTEGGTDKGSGTVYPNDAQYCFAEATALNSELAYTYTTKSTYFSDATGEIHLAGGFGSAAVTLKPRAAVLATITAPAYDGFYLAWFDSTGYKGAQHVSLINGTQTYLAPCPGTSGDYTLALVSGARYDMLTSATTLNSIPDSEKPLTWSVSLAAHEIKAVSGTVSKTASENARYVTKPNSTMTADRESFATTGDLVRFTGAIGLDDDLSGGELKAVTLYPKNEADNVSYSNSATVQYMVINGKLYDASQAAMASTGYYYFNVSGDNIELPCTYTLYCKPGSLDWDMQMSMFVNVTYSGGSTSEQLVGSATVKKPGASITTLSTSVCSDLVYVNGTAKPDEPVSIYDGETLVGTATANHKGLWSAKVPLANTDSVYASTHVLTSRTDKARSEDLYVFHDPNGPELTSFRMSWEEYGRDYSINVGEGYTYHGRMEEVTFTAVFKNPEKLRATIYGDANETSKVAFVYYLTNGTIATVYGSEQGGGVFTATLPGTIYSSVTAADVLYDPILNSRPTATVDGVATYALTATDLDEYADALNAAAAQDATVSATHSGDSFTASNEVLTGINAKYEGTGMEIQAFAVDYNDKTSFFKWMNDSAAAWTSGNREANSVGIFNKSVVFANKADYDAQLAQIKAYATWQSALENYDSSVTGGQFFFTDMKYDAELNLTDEGSYMAEFNTFCDMDRGLYAIVASLALDYRFQHYATDLPNNVATLTSSSGSGFGNATLLWTWGNEASKRDNISTTDAALMKYVQDGGIQKLFSLGPPNPVGIYNDIHNNATEHIETTAQSEMLALGARVDAGRIENSKEWQELKNAKDYYDRINPYSSFRSSSVELDSSVPTIGDRMDQINKDIEALKAIDGKLPSMDAKFALEMMKSFQDIADLGSAMTGGADINPVCPVFKFLQDVPGIICDKMTMDQIQERMDIYNRLMYNWNYVQNWYNSEIGFGDERFAPKENNGGGDSSGGTGGGGGQGGSGGSQGGSGGSGGQGGSGGTGGGVQDDTGTSSGSRAREIADQSKTRKPPISNKVSNDPSGIVFEGVIENPVEGALVTLYYAADPTGAVVKQTDDLTTATQLLQAEGVDDLIPSASTQTTGPDGRYAWGVPEGLWYVTAQAGTLEGNSDADKAATVAKDVDGATHLLPVLPVQLDVHIPLTDTAAPTVTDVVYAEGDGIYVTFSKYMQEGADAASCLADANYTVKLNGTETPQVTVSYVEAERGSVPANLDGAGTHYTRTVKLTTTPALAVGDNVYLTVADTVSSYAGIPMGTAYVAGSIVETQIKLGQPDVLVNGAGDPVISATLAVERGSALVLSLPATAPATAKIYYKIDGGATKTYDAASPIVVNNDLALVVWCEAPGYQTSDERTIAVTCSNTLPMLTADKAGVSLTAGSSDTVTVTLLDANDRPIAGQTVTAVSDASGVATVTASAVTGADGKATFTVTGVAGGSATITFDVLNITASVTVTVAGQSNNNNAQPTYTGGVGVGSAAETVRVTGEEEITDTPKVSNGKAEAEISQKIAAEALKGAEAGDTLTVKVETQGADSVTAKLPAAAVQTVADADVDVRVETENGAVKLSAETLDVLAKTGTEASVTVKENNDGTVTVDVAAGGQTVDAAVKVELPAASGSQVLVIVKPDGSEEIVKKSLVENGKVYAVVSAGAAVKVVSNAKSFPDVAADAWYAGAVEFVASHGLFQGTNRGFEPATTMTRAMLATVLFRLEGGSADGLANPFGDVPDDAWYTDAVIWANSVGIVQGKGDGFDPAAPVTREQIATMLFRYANMLGLDTSGRAALSGFPDGGQTSGWAEEAMQWAVSVGLFKGNANGSLKPGGNATRAEVATLLQRMIGLIVK